MPKQKTETALIVPEPIRTGVMRAHDQEPVGLITRDAEPIRAIVGNCITLYLPDGHGSLMVIRGDSSLLPIVEFRAMAEQIKELLGAT